MHETKSRKPANTAFKQQRLRAWQPILTPKTVIPTFFIIATIFAPLGGLLFYASDTVSEISIDYTSCGKNGSDGLYHDFPNASYNLNFPASLAIEVQVPRWKATLVSNDQNFTDPWPQLFVPTTRCTLQFSVPAVLKPPVFIYYRLTNFYQNHRRYVKSVDSAQLKGQATTSEAILRTDCAPIDLSPTGLPTFPCGLIANSFFNDTINVSNITSNMSNTPYSFSEHNIAWPSDAQLYKPTSYQFNQVVPPPNWASRYPNGVYTSDFPPPDLSKNEHFQVWMRTAGLPNFRKLYGRNDNVPLTPAVYELNIDMNFDVSKYGGTKWIVISTVSPLGGKNPFLGIAYLGVGIICFALGLVFLAIQLYKPRKLGDHTYLSWNQGLGGAGGGMGGGTGGGMKGGGGDRRQSQN